jgi:hypothetical protein
MSFGWTQYDEAMSHVPFALQRPEQQSVFALHVFPAVVQDEPPLPPSPDPPPPIGAHLPPTHVAVQQAFPLVGQLSPIVTHCEATHAPFTHAPLQQSVPTEHAALAGAHAPIEEVHCPPRQSVEQQSPPLAHAVPTPPHVLPVPGPPAPSPFAEAPSPFGFSAPSPPESPPSSPRAPSCDDALPHASGGTARRGASVKARR